MSEQRDPRVAAVVHAKILEWAVAHPDHTEAVGPAARQLAELALTHDLEIKNLSPLASEAYRAAVTTGLRERDLWARTARAWLDADRADRADRAARRRAQQAVHP